MDTGQRFLLRATLGAGATSIVYRAFDRARGHDVALKVLRSAAPHDLARFKREFRCFADVAHPNVVRLHELHHDARGWSITMELVDGLPLTRYARHVGPLVPGPPMATATTLAKGAAGRRWTTIEGLLYQLADAVHALHRSGAVHRDLKPSNVLVEPRGRVVVLDFGLARHHDAADDRRGLVVGTPSYMAPEQAADEPPTASADWYSVGVMLFEALTGRRPFEGTPLQVMAAKQAHEAPPARLFVPDLPEHLDRLCTALLQRDPYRRMEGAELFAELGARPSAPTLAIGASRPPATSQPRPAVPSVLDGAPAAILVHGPPGAGRSTVLRRAAADAAARGALVLAARVDRRESIPYRALDAVVDAAAAAVLAATPPCPAQLAALAALGRHFPALQYHADLVDPGAGEDSPGAALGRLLRLLARARPVVVAIDDVQASDAASHAALAAVVGTSGAWWLLAADDRDDATPALAAALRAACPPLIELELAPLDEDDAVAVWQAHTGRRAGEHERRLVGDCGGSPALVTLLATSGLPGCADDLAAWSAARARALSAPARALLRAVASSPRPVDAILACVAAAVAPPASPLAELRASGLVRTSHRDGRDLLAIADERLRAPVLGDLGDDERRALHRTIAVGLETLAAVDHEALVEHWLIAGDATRARRHAAFAASRAEDVMAFDRAERYYAIALADEGLAPARRRHLAVRRASALACAGRLGEAAAQYAAAADGADDDERVELLRLEVEQRLRDRQPEVAVARGAELLAAVGCRLPRAGLPSLATIVRHRAAIAVDEAVPWRRRRPVTPAHDRRMRALATVAAGMAFLDPIAGDAIQLRLWREVLASGEKAHLAQATALRLAYRGAAGHHTRDEVERLCARGLELAAEVDDPVLAGWLHGGSGVASYFAGDYREARDRIARGQRVLRQRGGDVRWLVDIGDIYLTAAQWMLGDGRGLRRTVPALLRDAQARGDRLAERALRGWRSNALWLLLDQADEAQRHVEAIGGGPRAGALFSAGDFHELLSRAQIDLYRGHGAAAHRRLGQEWPRLMASSLRVVQAARTEAWFLRGRCALAAAPGSPERRRLHGVALLAARHLARERTAAATAYAAALRATVGQQRGDTATAYAQLSLAAAGFGAAEMTLYAAAAHAHLAAVVGGSAGDALATEAGAAMTAAAVASPAALTAMLLPGW